MRVSVYTSEMTVDTGEMRLVRARQISQTRRRQTTLVTQTLAIACFAVLAVPGLVSSRSEWNRIQSSPKITITRIPAKGAGPDAMETIAGTVSGVDFTKCQVVVFARTNTWYVQPYAASPYTAIGSDGKWETKIHLGDEYAALLVERSYRPPATTDTLPEISGPVLAIAKATASTQSDKKSAAVEPAPKNQRMIRFAGYKWRVKSSSAPVGPGPNYFSDSEDNVRVDNRGRLHLRISQRSGRWYSAEIISSRSFGYGTYKFYLHAKPENIDPEAVLGLFTWSDEPAYSHREIDIEVSRWGKADNQNAQFVVQPYERAENIHRFQIPDSLEQTVHTFIWKPGQVSCRTMTRAQDANRNVVIQEHTFNSGVPVPGGENARMNLWLMTSELPPGYAGTEIIISKFEFKPLKKTSRSKNASSARLSN